MIESISLPTNSITSFNIVNFVIYNFQTYFANAQFLGQYTCNATNEFGSASINFTVEETIFPNVPVVHVKESYDKGFRFNIYQSPPMQNLTNFKIEYKKLSDNSTKWQDNDLPLSTYIFHFFIRNQWIKIRIFFLIF